ncbi:MAG: response regulator [Planctomycetes bacterium]|nr:response regulator [Planctomycetota bacterium]
MAGPEIEGGRGRQPARILIIDDTPANRYVLGAILRQGGYEVVEASNATEGLTLLDPGFDLAICDVDLPDINGLELCRRIKADPRLRSLMVLSISAHFVTREDRATGFESGADGYLIHPIDQRELLAQVRALLRLGRAERDLRTSDERMRVALAAAPLCIYSVDDELRYTWIHGDSVDDPQGVENRNLPPCEALAEVVALKREVLTTGIGVRRTVRLHDVEPLRWFDYAIEPMRDGAGATTGLSVVVSEVSAQHRAQDDLRESQSIYRNMAESNLFGLCVTHNDGRVLDANDEYLRIIGRDRAALERGEVRWDTATADEHRALSQDKVVEIRRTGRTTPFTKDYVRPDGARTPVLVAAASLDGSQRNVAMVLDLSRQHQVEAQLKDTADELRQRNQELEEFASIASHDLQAPLRLIVNFLGLLERRAAGTLDDKALAYIRQAVDGAARMRELIRGLLEYSRFGTCDAEDLPVASGLALDDALTALRAETLESGAQIQRGELPVVRFNRLHLAQVFQNLISNALKYRDGKPTVRISAARDGGQWAFSVSDNGLGIAPTHHESIFAMFTRLHTQAEISGTGIGLALCRKLVTQRGGRIWVESEAGKGATFHFTIAS